MTGSEALDRWQQALQAEQCTQSDLAVARNAAAGQLTVLQQQLLGPGNTAGQP